MTKARFYITDKPLQGLRGRGAEPTMEKILNSGLNLKGTAINAGLNVPDSDSMRSSQALMLGQLSRGIVYIAGMSRSIDGMGGRIEGMDESIKGMDEKLDTLPEKIGREIDKSFERHFETLPERIAKELKKVLK